MGHANGHERLQLKRVVDPPERFYIVIYELDCCAGDVGEAAAEDCAYRSDPQLTQFRTECRCSYRPKPIQAGGEKMPVSEMEDALNYKAFKKVPQHQGRCLMEFILVFCAARCEYATCDGRNCALDGTRGETQESTALQLNASWQVRAKNSVRSTEAMADDMFDKAASKRARLGR